jgi:hypothetical protein
VASSAFWPPLLQLADPRLESASMAKIEATLRLYMAVYGVMYTDKVGFGKRKCR